VLIALHLDDLAQVAELAVYIHTGRLELRCDATGHNFPALLPSLPRNTSPSGSAPIAGSVDATYRLTLVVQFVNCQQSTNYKERSADCHAFPSSS
jgi:hypothetical protein